MSDTNDPVENFKHATPSTLRGSVVGVRRLGFDLFLAFAVPIALSMLILVLAIAEPLKSPWNNFTSVAILLMPLTGMYFFNTPSITQGFKRKWTKWCFIGLLSATSCIFNKFVIFEILQCRFFNQCPQFGPLQSYKVKEERLVLP